MRLQEDDIQTPNQLVLRREGEQVVEVDIRPVSSALSSNLHELSQQAEGLSPEQQQQLQDVIQKWQGVVARNEENYGHTTAVHHTIPTVPPSSSSRNSPTVPGLRNTARVPIFISSPRNSPSVPSSPSP
ncbi:hypothetical protein SKAU_G00159070 [Synaphobranchus kaupii]|uniref:Uncharacterized protein n=1 Tax=Synaphobranchus kaupii TaxID=118154 RepID=A0A9Q1FIL0_SYNKA|nr:hypothetical protein SKAU_G00159070 [Synaphobranchus kaupii]